MKKLLLFLLLAPLCATSQLVLEHTYSDNVVTRVQLENSGEKYYVYNPSTSSVDFYNANHSFWKSIPLPVSQMYGIQITHVSETLLNPDDVIEIVFSYFSLASPYYYSYVLSEDGTALLTVVGSFNMEVVILASGAVKLIANKGTQGSEIFDGNSFMSEQTFPGLLQHKRYNIAGDRFYIFDQVVGKADFYDTGYTLWKSITLPKPAGSSYTTFWPFSENELDGDEELEVSYGYTLNGVHESRIIDEQGNLLLNAPNAVGLLYSSGSGLTPRVLARLVTPTGSETQYYSIPQMTLEATYPGDAQHVALDVSGEKFYTFSQSGFADGELRLYNADHSLWKTIPLAVPNVTFGYIISQVSHISENVLDDDPGIELAYTYFESILLEQTNYTTDVIEEDGTVLNSIPQAAGLYLSEGEDWDPKFIGYMDDGFGDAFPAYNHGYGTVWNIGAAAGIEKVQRVVSVYPNPFFDKIDIATSGIPIAKAELFDVFGRPLLAFAGNDLRQLHLGVLASGPFVLRLTDETGRTSVHKILKR